MKKILSQPCASTNSVKSLLSANCFSICFDSKFVIMQYLIYIHNMLTPFLKLLLCGFIHQFSIKYQILGKFLKYQVKISQCWLLTSVLHVENLPIEKWTEYNSIQFDNLKNNMKIDILSTFVLQCISFFCLPWF